MADKIGKAITGYQNLVPAPNDREGTAAVKLMATRYGCKYKYTYMGTRWYRGSTCKRKYFRYVYLYTYTDTCTLMRQSRNLALHSWLQV